MEEKNEVPLTTKKSFRPNIAPKTTNSTKNSCPMNSKMIKSIATEREVHFVNFLFHRNMDPLTHLQEETLFLIRLAQTQNKIGIRICREETRFFLPHMIPSIFIPDA